MLKEADQIITQQDPAIPGLRLLFDQDSLLEKIRTAPGLPHVQTLEIDYLRYKMGENCLARFRCRGEGLDTWGYAKAYGKNAFTKLDKSSRRQDKENAHGLGRILLKETGTEINFLPNDNKLPSLGRISETEAFDALLARVFKQGSDWSDSGITVLNYKPERRLTARLSHASGREAVLKFFTADTFAHSRRFHRSLAPVDGISLQSLIGSSKAHHVLGFAWLPGERLQDEITRGNVTVGAQAGEALARFHQCAQASLSADDPDRRIARVNAMAGDLSRLLPDLAPEVQSLAKELTEWWARRQQMHGTVHGDFNHEQVITGATGVALIDCDNAHYGEPRLDVGSFLARLDYDILLGRINSDAGDMVNTHFIETYANAGNSLDELPRFVAFGLFHLLHHPFRERASDWPTKTRDILSQCQSLFGACS